MRRLKRAMKRMAGLMWTDGSWRRGRPLGTRILGGTGDGSNPSVPGPGWRHFRRKDPRFRGMSRREFQIAAGVKLTDS